MAQQVAGKKLGPSHLSDPRYEVQRQNNFEIFIYGIDGATDITLAVTQGPTVTQSNEEIQLAFGNRNVKVAGKAQYDTGNLTVKDFIGADVSALIQAWQKQVFNPLTDQVGLAANYKKQARLVQYSPDGSTSRSWVLTGVWPQQVNYGTNDYTASDAQQIDITLMYDLAIQDRS